MFQLAKSWRRTSFNRVIIKIFSFLPFLEVETSSVKNAFLIGEINFEKKFNTFENDTHQREREREIDGQGKKKHEEIQLKKQSQNLSNCLRTENFSSIIKSETRKSF